MAAIFFWGSLAIIMFCVGAIVYVLVNLVRSWKHYDSDTRMNAVILALKGTVGVGFTAVIGFVVFFISYLFHQPFSPERMPHVLLGALAVTIVGVIIKIVIEEKNKRSEL